MESIFLTCSSIQKVHSSELKFGMYIIGNHPTHCIDFGKFRISICFLQEYKKEFLCFTAYGVKLKGLCLWFKIGSH